MKYYDFDANWKRVNKLLHSKPVTAILKKYGLSHPLWSCARTDCMVQIIDKIVEADPKYIKEKAKLDEDESTWDDESSHAEYYKLDDKYFKKHSKPDMMHSNIPQGRCHQLAPALFYMAKKLFPDNQWVYIDGDNHSSVYSPDAKILFDLLFYYFYTHENDKDLSSKRVFKQIHGRKCKHPRDGNIRNTEYTACVYTPK